MRTEPKSRILEALSKFAETSRRGAGSAIGDPEQTSPADHPFRPAGAPELLCSVAVVIAEQAAQSLTTSHLPVGTTDAFFRFEQRVPEPLMVALSRGTVLHSNFCYFRSVKNLADVLWRRDKARAGRFTEIRRPNTETLSCLPPRVWALQGPARDAPAVIHLLQKQQQQFNRCRSARAGSR